MAVQLVVNGMPVADAWDEVGKPGRTRATALRNIRSRFKRVRQRMVDAEPTPTPKAARATGVLSVPRTQWPAVEPLIKGKNGEAVAFRMRADQVDKQDVADKRLKRIYVDALKSSTAEYKQQQSGAGVMAPAVAARYNTTLQEYTGAKLLTGQAIRHHVASGWAGLSPPGKGPKPAVPQIVVDLLSTHASMSQINGNELKPRAIRCSSAALVNGTTLAQHLHSKQQRSKFLKRLRQSGLRAVPKVICDNRRWMYLTYTNVNRYFADGSTSCYRTASPRTRSRCSSMARRPRSPSRST